MPARPSPPTLLQALMPLVLLVALLAANVLVFGDDSLSGPNQLVLLFAAAVAFVVGLRNGHGYRGLMRAVVRSITTAVPAIIILLLIGALAGSWMVAGIVPAMIVHGLALLSPKGFLVAACLVCAVVSLATGSSWSTAATVGIALMGIGRTLGFHDGLVAGAIISGAYFGDKLSPLSDTTNLAPAVAGAELFGHIRYLLNTTLPSITIALLLFLLIGLRGDGAADAGQVSRMQELIGARFHISIWLYLPPLAVVLMIARRVPALPALFIGTLLGALWALLFQRPLLLELAGNGAGLARDAYTALLTAMGAGTAITTGEASVDELLVAKGMAGMLGTIWLILCAMCFGGAMEGAGLLQRITAAIMGAVRGDGSLIATTSASCVVANATASDQYLAIVVPGRMFAPVYRERGLDPRVLSRTLEDAGTVTSPLIPWNTCGAYQAQVLGVATFTYLPFCFFNLLSPLMTVLQGAIGWRIIRRQAAGGGA